MQLKLTDSLEFFFLSLLTSGAKDGPIAGKELSVEEALALIRPFFAGPWSRVDPKDVTTKAFECLFEILSHSLTFFYLLAP